MRSASSNAGPSPSPFSSGPSPFPPGSGAHRVRGESAPGRSGPEDRRFEAYGPAAIIAVLCLALAAALVAVVDHGRLGLHSLLETAELGLLGFLTLLWTVGSVGRWRELRRERGLAQAPSVAVRELALAVPCVLPTLLLVVAYAVLVWLTFATPGFDPRTTPVALGMILLVGLGRLAWRLIEVPRSAKR
ncbi:MAG: hypothetical protein MI919_04535, partial [Holophagales bacterium]|nr:hypothetical protein [Holophagales bacterium]